MDVLAVTVQEGPDGLVKMLNEKQVSVYSGDLNAAKLDEWVKSIIMKSEPVPEGSPVFQDGSLVVVGRTFEELVVRANKDVALLVYAPWCGYCRKVMPVWNSFGRAVSAVPSLVVAKMDGDQNSATNVDFSWSSYPTIFFVKAGSEQPVVFHGNRTVTTLVQFAKDHGSPFDLDPSVNLESDSEL